MPAVERELLDAIFELAPKGSITSVLAVSAYNSRENVPLIRLMKEEMKLNVKAVEGVDGVENIMENNLRDTDGLYDAIISNKVMVSDDLVNEPRELLAALLKVVMMDGIVIIREDFVDYRASEKVVYFTQFLDHYQDSFDGIAFGFELCTMKQVDATIHATQNFMDVFWVLRKKQLTRTDEKRMRNFRVFLDSVQYSDKSIAAYEWIFGENFISPGGYNENMEVLKRFGDLKPGSRMLDIGVGIGGGARQAATEFGLYVHGIDLSSNMLSRAMDRLQFAKDGRIRYQICNAITYQFPNNSFDYVFSRDCLHHNERMDIVLQNIYNWLKPDGKFLITIYGKGNGVWTAKFEGYVKKREYYLKTLDEMVQIAKSVGFKNVEGTNLTARLREILLSERTKAINKKEVFIEKFNEEVFNELLNGWNDKIEFIDNDNHNWLQIYGSK